MNNHGTGTVEIQIIEYFCEEEIEIIRKLELEEIENNQDKKMLTSFAFSKPVGKYMLSYMFKKSTWEAFYNSPIRPYTS